MNENHTWTKAKLILIETVTDVMFGNFLLILTKVPVLKCQKMALRVPKPKIRDHFLMPKNGGSNICFMRLALLDGFKANFKDCTFCIVLNCFSCYMDKQLKVPNDIQRSAEGKKLKQTNQLT